MAVTLIINGRRVQAPAGSTVLQAARLAGMRVPTLCHHPDLTNVGACRVCVVTVEGAKGPQTACTTPVAEGMLVDTESGEATATRRFVLRMLLSDHPNDCMRCESDGDCELQALAYEYDVPWPERAGVRHTYPVDPDPTPFIYIDRNKCILCGRCVRACAEIQNRDVWNFAGRGFEMRVVAGADQLLLDANCESCGQCVAYCPVGALYDKMSLHTGRAIQVTKVRTTCSYCGVGCNFDLNVRNGRVIRVTSAPDAPVNGMTLCVKGRYGYDYIHHPDRLAHPLVRAKWLDPGELAARVADGAWRMVAPQPMVPAGAGGRRPPGVEQPDVDGREQSHWVEVDWDTALDIAAGRFAEVKRTSGGDALGILTSAKCTNEENYLANKLARQVFGTNNIDHCARL